MAIGKNCAEPDTILPMVVPSTSKPLLKPLSAPLIIRRLRAGAANLFHRWQSLQVSYRGHKCSIERLLALEQYTRTTSLWRVLTVVSGTLVPMVVLVVSQESIPLDDPTAGWKVNYGFWMRVGILAGVVSVSVAVHARYILGVALFTLRHLVLLFVCQALTYTFVSMGIAALVGFPIPFFALSTIPVFFVLLMVWFTAIVGRKTVGGMFKRSDEIKIHAQFICAQMLMPVVYPIYEVLFVAAMNTHYELPVILLLPIMKVVMKYIITLALVQKEDMLPESVILTVDFFHAVYLATCMQSSRSTVTAAIIIVVDVSQSLSMLSALHRRSRTTLARAHRAADIPSDKISMVTLLCIICSSSEKMDKQNINGIRIRSCLPHTLPPAHEQILLRLESLRQTRLAARSGSRSTSSVYLSPALRVIPSNNSTRVSQMCSRLCWWQRRTMIQPFPLARKSISSLSLPTTDPRSEDRRRSRRNSLIYRRSNILREGLEALFTSECLVLASYLHTSIALFYANFVVVMVYLPSARYHTELSGVTPSNVENTVRSVFIFGTLEFVSFALLAVMIYEKYGMQAFYHLAFVLETQVALIQCKVMMWMLIILAFRVVHFGVDFTLKFAWMKN